MGRSLAFAALILITISVLLSCIFFFFGGGCDRELRRNGEFIVEIDVDVSPFCADISFKGSARGELRP